MFKKFLIISFLYSIFSLIFLKTVCGQEQVAGVSAQIFSASSSAQIQPKFDFRPLKLRIFLSKKTSLLEEYALFMIKISDEKKVDWRLFPAISGVESGFCKAYIVENNNCVGWGGGYIQFNTIEEQIETVVSALRKNYIDDGLFSVDQIGNRYAADPAWSFKVKRNMEEIERTSIL